MKKRKLTERQQVRKWIEEDNLPDDIEETLNEIFRTVIIYKENHPNVTLRQAYAYAYMVYINKKIGE